MRRWFWTAMLLAIVSQTVGCYEGPPSEKNKPKANVTVAPSDAPVVAPPQLIEPAREQPAAAKAPEPIVANPPAVQPSPPSPPPSAPPSNEPRIRLSTGVALPQTTVDGTKMFFSVDYQYLQGEPAANRDVFVVERAHGAAHKQLVAESKGPDGRTLVAIPPNWRSEDGPFKAHVEDRDGNRISDSIELK